MSKKALVIIDIQNDYFEGGSLELHNPAAASKNAAKILSYFRENKLPVIHIQHISADPDAMPVFINETEGCKIHENVTPLVDEIVLQKFYPNSFRETGLLDLLLANQIKELVVVGMMTHMCVDATVRAAFDLGFKCTVIGDACASRDLTINGYVVKADDVHHAFLSALEFIYAVVKDTSGFLSGAGS